MDGGEMTRMNLPKKNIGYEKKVFIRPNGTAYHVYGDCEMLQNGDFEHYEYFEADKVIAIRRGYILCPMCYKRMVGSAR
jgi:hypothetical protein